MAVTQSTINIYADATLTSLVTSVTKSGSDTDIEVNGLSAGTAYWATAIATADGLTSEESEPYKFYTLPYIEFTGTMHTGPDWFSSLLQHTTTDVGISRWGICWSTSSSFTNPTYNLVKPMPSQEVKIEDLDENTTYYARACVLDEFGRLWVNPDTVTVTTGASLPQISWYGMTAVGQTDFHGSISVSSEIPLVSVVAVYTPVGGSSVTVNLSAVTGIQAVNLTGLTPNTQYSVVCTATNAQGSASTSAAVFTTNSAELTVELKDVAVSNENNIISVDSTASYDSNVITITGHYVDLYENPDHKGAAYESVSGGANSVISVNLSHANPDETYFVFSRVTYTVGSDPTELTAWSEPWEIVTYSLFSFAKVEVDNVDAKVHYAVDGHSDSTVIEYSTDGVTWTKVAVEDPDGGVVYFQQMDPNTTYYLRGRCKSAAGWSEWTTTQFTTGSSQATDIYITSITNVMTTSATIKLTIE